MSSKSEPEPEVVILSLPSEQSQNRNTFPKLERLLETDGIRIVHLDREDESTRIAMRLRELAVSTPILPVLLTEEKRPPSLTDLLNEVLISPIIVAPPAKERKRR